MPIGIIASISSNFLTKSEGIYATVNNIELVFVIIYLLFVFRKENSHITLYGHQ